MLTALSLTILTGFCFASISMIVSRIAHHRISFFQFFTVSNLTASAAAWILLPDWSLFSSIGWGKVLLITGSEGMAGAAVMTGRAAVRAGAGLTTYFIPYELLTILQTSFIEHVSSFY